MVVQVALSVVLVAGSLLFARTLAGLNAEPLGFHADGVLAVAVQPKLSDSEIGHEYFDELMRRLRALHGVQHVSIADQLPMEYAHYGQRGDVSVAAGDWAQAESHCVFPAYFATLGTPVLQGREFGTRDGSAIVISRMLSLQMFGTENSVGRTLREKRKGKTTDREVVGVVRDMKYGSPREQTEPAYYLPCLQDWTPKQAGSRGMSIAIRGVDAGLERAVRREVDALGRQVVFRATPLRDLLGLRMLNERMFAVVTSSYGLVTLMVVGVGLYGLMMFLVASRRREIGIRVAVGAQRSDVLWVVVREVLLVLGVGLGLGIGAALAGAKLVNSYVFGARGLDLSVLMMTTLVLALIGAVATFVPAQRALALRPTEALRHE